LFWVLSIALLWVAVIQYMPHSLLLAILMSLSIASKANTKKNAPSAGFINEASG